MPDFHDTRRAYAAARATAAQHRSALLRAKEQVARLTRTATASARRVGGVDAAHGDDDNADDRADATPAGQLRALQKALSKAKEEVARLRGSAADAAAASLLARGRFASFTDPIQDVSRLPDDVPVALFPLRLETRFKTITRDGAVIRMLWVRAFPDDVLVDTFQPEISDNELRNVTLYWTHRWRAGGAVSGHRAAWAALVRSHGAGRAHWLTQQVAPLNAAAEPIAQTGDHILVVTPPVPLAAAEKPAIARFWARIWSTSGAGHDAALAELAGVVGEVRAAAMEATLAPVNLVDPAVMPGPSLHPVVVFLDLPDAATLPLSHTAWTRGARAWLLPERLVLIGFRNGKKVLELPGELIPPELQIGPDPAADEGDQIKADGADLEIPAALKWTVDFDTAVTQGMGFSVNLTEKKLESIFDRLFVLGVRVGSDATDGAAELSTLIANHQASRKGFALLPQGRPTSNTDASTAGYTWWENPDESFKDFFEADPNDDPTDWRRRKDGAWLAGLLGLDRALLRGSPNYHGTDQAEARAMNTALWPATLGYYMEQMMDTVFSDATVQQTRDFFNRFVSGRGTVPLVRVGRQPYGILPATVWSKTAWWTQATYERGSSAAGLPAPAYLARLHRLCEHALGLWKESAESVANVAQPGADPHKTLLDIVGLHPVSAEFYQRYSQSFTQYYNTLGFATEPVSAPANAAARAYVEAGLLALKAFGWAAESNTAVPELLEKIFLKQPNLLKGDLVQAELSDSSPLAVTRADARNYIDWLQWAARSSHDTLRKQEGFADGVPTALLYLLLQHALDLGFVDAGLRFRREALQMSDTAYRAERKEPKFIQVAQQDGHSRWQALYRPEPAVTNDPALRLGDYVSKVLLSRTPYLNTQLSALDVLKDASSGALERALVEHIDTLSYRLDAWRMGMQAVQLSAMRQESDQGFGKGGIYVGAYGWLENVHAKTDSLTPVQLDPELAAIFADPKLPPLQHDSTNFGHVHAPSMDHAVTAAILRNGHLANATPQAPELLAVDLSSERVRLAQQMIEGIANGQSMGALLGYRLERALHDEPDLFLDRLIYDLRRAFPLVGNRNQRTKVAATTPISKVEARNVLDGLSFLDHLAAIGVSTYPYGLSDLPPLSQFTGPGLPGAAAIGLIIDAHVAAMRSIGDAVADVQVAEGVYQVVRGNYDRAAGMLDALSKGTHPPLPEVVTTPRKGRTLTHRIALHLQGGLLPADPANTTPRAQAEPALAQWLAGQLPDPATVFAKVSWHDEAAGIDVTLTPSMTDLGLAPVDLFYMLDAGGASAMPGFDDLLIDFAERNGAPAPRHNAQFALEYRPAGVAGINLFKLAPLVRALRGAVLGARPLRPSDLSLQNEAARAEDAGPIARADKVAAVRTSLQATAAAIGAFVTAVDTAIGDGVDPVAARDAARDNIDAWIVDYLAMIRPVAPFGLQAASLTTAVEGRRARFTAILGMLNEVQQRWLAKRNDFDSTKTAYDNLPVTASDQERSALLIRAGRIVSTRVIAPLPATLVELENQVTALRDAFDIELAQLSALRDGATTVGAALSALTALVPSMTAIDQTPFDLEPPRSSVLALAQDLAQKAVFLRDDIDRRVAAATAALTRAAAAQADKAQAAVLDAAHAIFGDAFMVLPEFTLPDPKLAEWSNAWAHRAELLTHLGTGPEATPFPADDWLHGVARVRERPRFLELATLLGEPLGAAAAPTLEPLQFPYRSDDAWLGLRFPATFANGEPFAVAEDKLLYSAHFGPGAQIQTAQSATTYSGLMLDEWIEVIPTDEATTGLAFHFDRPNSEAPQAILLVTPPMQRETWQWDDLVETLHETLEFARMRAVEPTQLDQTSLGPLLPAVMSAVTLFPITAMLNFAFNNEVHLKLAEAG